MTMSHRRHLHRAIWLAGLLVVSATVRATGARFDFLHFGHFDRMTQGGDTRGHVKLSALPQSPAHWGLGALAGLKGEVLMHDGRLLVSRGHDDRGRVAAPEPHDEAALFAGAKVEAWAEVRVPSEMIRAELEGFVAEHARTLGLNLDEPFTFLVEGRYPTLVWHVVTGAPAANAGHAGTHGGPAPHANRQSGMRVFEQAGSQGRLVGVYSGSRLEGVVSHAGERFHLHYADAELSVSGHVDAYSVARGAVLKLPAR